VLKWPDQEEVDRAVRQWAAAVAHPEVLRIGYFGSYARGNWGVGSDLDLVVVVERSDLPFERRGNAWDLTDLPVPAELLVYTEEEWATLPHRSRFGQTLRNETVWVYGQANA
jgi:predicted nucleotidyltransferase